MTILRGSQSCPGIAHQIWTGHLRASPPTSTHLLHHPQPHPHQSWAEPCSWLHVPWEHPKGFLGVSAPWAGAGTAWQRDWHSSPRPLIPTAPGQLCPGLPCRGWQQPGREPGRTCPRLPEPASPTATPPHHPGTLPLACAGAAALRSFQGFRKF